MIAALYVLRDGPYYGIDDVDPWDIERDARLYEGPHPVVAHPPCARWSKLAWQVASRGGPGIGDDGGCFAAALDAVRTWGGVLEHPAHSMAWDAFGLPPPAPGGWTRDLFGDGASCQVDQGHYGHLARKTTWLYAVGCALPALTWGPAPQRLPERRLRERGYRSAVRCGMVANMSRRQRALTPTPFRDVLLEMARSVEPQEARCTR